MNESSNVGGAGSTDASINNGDEPPDRRLLRRKGQRLRIARISLCLRAFQTQWRRLSPPQQVIAGYLAYVVLGVLLLSLPWAQARPAGFLDNLFGVTSAISTTGLVTLPTGDSYSFLGQLVHLLLFQLGGIGYMTLSSFIILSRGGRLSREREGILKTGFAVPRYFHIDRFVRQLMVYTVAVEAVGAMLLWYEFSIAAEPEPLWSAIFHCVSAFATAGFGLHGDSLERYAGNPLVQITIGVLPYLGAIGFIVVQDAYYSIRYREHMITFTSKVILVMTTGLFVLGTPLFFFIEPEIRHLPIVERLMASAFQVMTASTTAGFNTIPISPLSLEAMWLIVLLMLIGASPSGTGGGIKTTTVSAIAATMNCIVRGRSRICLLGNEIPLERLLSAVAATKFYGSFLFGGVMLLTLTERQPFVGILFEAASGLGTVGLSTGITAELTWMGKWIVILLMFAGRVGPLTIGLALMKRTPQAAEAHALEVDDLAV